MLELSYTFKEVEDNTSSNVIYIDYKRARYYPILYIIQGPMFQLNLAGFAIGGRDKIYRWEKLFVDNWFSRVCILL